MTFYMHYYKNSDTTILHHFAFKSLQFRGMQNKSCEHQKAPTSKQDKLPFPISVFLNSHRPTLCSSVWFLSLALYFSSVTDSGGWVAMAARSRYVARMLQREPEKEQPTLVTMATHLLGVLSGSSFLRHWSLSLIGPSVSLCAAFALLSNLPWLSAHALSLSLLVGFTSTPLFLSFTPSFPSLFVPFFFSFECMCVCVCVQLPVCAWESSPGPGRQSCPLRCGTLLWSLHRWRCCLDWASTGDTSPTKQQSIPLFSPLISALGSKVRLQRSMS